MNNAIPQKANIMAGNGAYTVSSTATSYQYQISDVLNCTPDAYYKDELYKKLPKGGTSSISNDILKLNLDITRISDRIIVMGSIWNHKTNKQSHRNNIDEVALFLNTKYGKKYMIWNLGSPDMKYNTSPFRNQVMNFQLSKLLTFSIKSLFNICRTLFAWMDLDDDNVVIIHCKNGKNRTGLIVACFLRYLELFDTTYESLEYFISKRTPGEIDWVTITLRRYLRYFNDIIILNGRIPNSMPLKLHQILVNTVPDFDGNGSCDPGVEIYQNGKLTYSSIIKELELEDDLLFIPKKFPLTVDEDSEAVYDDEELVREFQVRMALQDKSQKVRESLVLKDAHHIVFRLDNVILHGDVQIRLYHQNRHSKHNTTILNLAFNTSFLAPGLIRLKIADLELPLMKIPPPGSVPGKMRFDREFSLDMVATNVDDSSKLISYESATMKCRAKNLLKLSQFHSIRADPTLIKPLELQGYHKFFARLGLQLRNNDIHLAHEFLSILKSNSSYYDSIDKELVMLGKMKYEKMKGIGNMNHYYHYTHHRKSLENINEEESEKVDNYHSMPAILEEEKQQQQEKEKRQDSITKLENPLQLSENATITTTTIPPPSSKNDKCIKEDFQIQNHHYDKKVSIDEPKLSFLDQIKKNRKMKNVEIENDNDNDGHNNKDNPNVEVPHINEGERKGDKEKEKAKVDMIKDNELPRPSISLPVSQEKNLLVANNVNSTKESLDSSSLPPPPPPPLPCFMGKKKMLPLSSTKTLLMEKEIKFERENIQNDEMPIAPPPLPFLKAIHNHHQRIENNSVRDNNDTIKTADASEVVAMPPPPPPPPLLLKKASKSSDLNRTESIDSFHSSISDDQNRFKIKHRLNWNEIKDKHKIRNSVWIELLEQYPEYDVDSLDVHKFEELFCVDVDEKPSSSSYSSSFLSKSISKSKENLNTARILELKRANNIGIGLSRFYKRMNDSEILDAIINIDERLSLDDLLTLQNIIPLEEERQLLDLFKGPKDRLIRSEQFVLEMVREPHLSWMINALIYIKQFNGDYSTLCEKLITTIGLLTKLRESPDLKIILKGALEVGNLASYDYARLSAHSRSRGKALGFTMDSLTKLHEVKSVDKKTNLLDYVATGLISKYSGLALLPQEFTDLTAAKHWDSSLLEGSYLELERIFEKLRNEKLSLIKDNKGSQIGIFRENLDGYLISIQVKLQELKLLLENMKSLWNRTAEYFGESPEEMKIEELFTIFDQFFKYFSLAVQNSIKETDRQHHHHQLQQSTTLSRTSSQDSFTTRRLVANSKKSSHDENLQFEKKEIIEEEIATTGTGTGIGIGMGVIIGNYETESTTSYSGVLSTNDSKLTTKFGTESLQDIFPKDSNLPL